MEYRKQLERLNEYQKAAVMDDSHACLVSANVGSGKTTVLIAKILYLHYEKQVRYEDMMVLTFTNKAAGEIKERLTELDPGVREEELHGFGTFHSVCLELLRSKLPVETLQYTREFLVVEPEEELDMALEIIGREKLKIKYKNRLKKRLDQAMTAKEDASGNGTYQDDFSQLVCLLKEEKIRQNKMTFADLIANAIGLLRAEVTVPEEEKDHEGEAASPVMSMVWPEWVIIDEVQDSDTFQLDLIDLMKQHGARLFAVGDPNQVIYSWRGSAFHVFYTLKHRYDATELSLPVNYRSSSSILEAAGRFLQHGGGLEGVREPGSKITVKKHYDSFSEASYLGDQIEKLHKDGIPYGEIAVFYRLQDQSGMLQDIFTRQGIPFEVSVKKTIQDVPVLDWLIRVLRFSLNQSDMTSAAGALSHRVYGENLAKKELQRILREQDFGCSWLYDRMWGLQKMCQGRTDGAWLYEYYDLDRYLHPAAASYEEDKAWVELFLQSTGEFIEEKQLDFYEGLRAYMNSSALFGLELIRKKEQQDSVKLMTLHASKGLEFSHVFIIGVNDGLIPLQTKSPDGEEEERRLFFVGITRAKDKLELSYYINPGSYRALPGEGRYIRMIPPALLQREAPEEERVSLRDLKRQIIAEREIKDAELKKESQPPLAVMKHRKYGNGHLVEEDDMMIVVEFEHYGRKEFMKGFCEQEFLADRTE